MRNTCCNNELSYLTQLPQARNCVSAPNSVTEHIRHYFSSGYLHSTNYEQFINLGHREDVFQYQSIQAFSSRHHMRKKRATTSGEQVERLMDTDNIIRRSRYGFPGICINGQTAISIAFRFATARQMTVQEHSTCPSKLKCLNT